MGPWGLEHLETATLLTLNPPDQVIRTLVLTVAEQVPTKGLFPTGTRFAQSETNHSCASPRECIPGA
jgi:hypothetical protein